MSILDEKIEKASNICILGHTNPDGDCIGSVLSIYNYILLKYKDKKVKAYLQMFSPKYNVMKNADKISHDDNDAVIYDLAIVCDCGNEDRLKEFARYFREAHDSILFDHHENNTIAANVKVVDDKSIATCEILYDNFDKNYIDKDIATCLYIGIATDSGVFRYKATTRKTLNIAGELISYGFDFTNLLDSIVFNNSIVQRRAQAIVFERIKLLKNATISYSYITDDELSRLHMSKNDLDNMIVYLREIDGIKIACFIYPIGNNIYKLSLRSTDDRYNVARFAEKHEGGGHALASGCVYYGTIDAICERFEKDIIEFAESCE